VFFSLGSKPLELWNKVVGVEGGEIRKVTDQDIQSPVYELLAPNTLIPKVYLACPADPSKTLGIKLREDLSLFPMTFLFVFDPIQDGGFSIDLPTKLLQPSLCLPLRTWVNTCHLRW